MRSAKHSTLVKECREFLQTAEAWLQPLTFWRPNRGARLLSNLITSLNLPDAASSVEPAPRSLSKKPCTVRPLFPTLARPYHGGGLLPYANSH